MAWPPFITPILLARKAQTTTGEVPGGGRSRFISRGEVGAWFGAEGFPLDAASPAPVATEPGRARAAFEAALASWLAEAPEARRVVALRDRFQLQPSEVAVVAFLNAIHRDESLAMVCDRLAGDPAGPVLSALSLATLLACDAPGWVPAFVKPLLPGGSLVAAGIVVVGGGPGDLRQRVRLEGQVAAWLAGAALPVLFDGARGTPRFRERRVDSGSSALFYYRESLATALAVLGEGADIGQRPALLAVRGVDPRVRLDTALAVAFRMGLDVLEVDTAAWAPGEIRSRLARLGMWQRLWRAAIVLDQCDAWADEAADVLATLSEQTCLPILLTLNVDTPRIFQASPAFGVVAVKPASAKMRATVAEGVLADTAEGRAALAPVLDEHVLDLAMTEAVAREVAARAYGEGDAGAPDAAEVAMNAAVASDIVQRHLGSRVTDVAERVVTRAGLNQLEVSDDARQALRELIAAWKNLGVLADGWGLGSAISNVACVTGLFHGPPGTGKTLCASMIAHELGMQLYRVDLSRVVDKYIGETEKQLERVFSEAERSRVMLLFDEADSLFGARTDVKKASDRFSNMQVGFLLQRLEVHRGVVVLTTNHENLLDSAFRRRIRYSIHFPMPDAAERARLWRRFMPPGAPLAADVDFEYFGTWWELSGGHIRNVVLRAAFAAAASGSVITPAILEDAANVEYRSLGHIVRTYSTS